MQDDKSFGDVINSFFDHVYVITLPRSKVRQKEVEQELEKHSVRFSFVEGIDGSKLELSSLDKNIYNRELAIEIVGFPITQGELGCSLSVLKICKNMVKNNEQSVLVLQDDIKVLTSNIKHATSLLSSVNFPWDLLYLGHTEDCMNMPLKIKAKIALDYVRYRLNKDKYTNPVETKNSYRRPFKKYWFKAGAHNGGYAYGLSLEGAKKLIEAFTPVFAVDDITFKYLVVKGNLKAYSPKYFLIGQRWDLGSEIGDRPSWNPSWDELT
jgi:GR25 family glycosyltransferase involved in LPS biosynthesis